MPDVVVRVRGLTKRYGATLALDDIDLSVAAGEVHALLGHNGAGKSTLIKCLGGGTRPSSGVICLGGSQLDGLQPRESIKQGVAVIYQQLSLIPSLTVSENLFLGHELRRGVGIDRKEQEARSRELLDRLGAGIEPSALVAGLPIAQRQLVEIAKALIRDARLLILDEPTAALSPIEAERLAELVHQLRSEGVAILYVTHLLNEVLRLADRVTVLRNGRVTWTAPMSGHTKSDLIEAISGMTPAARRPARPASEGSAAVLRVERLSGPSLGPVSFDVGPGEIVGVYGLVGSGRTRLLETLFGCREISGGRILIDGAPVHPKNPGQALTAGIALVPSDRQRQGMFGPLSALDNAVIRVMRRIGGFGRRDVRAERRLFAETARQLSVTPPSARRTVNEFSGGNQQKILIGRWVNAEFQVRVLLLDDPTQGVDVGARLEIYDAIRRQAAERQIAVVLTSNEPEELMAIAHRCLVIRDAQIVDEVVTTETDEDRLLELIHG